MTAAYQLIGDQHAMVEQFNLGIIGMPIPSTPTLLEDSRADFRLDHIDEENREARKAQAERDLEGFADAMVDVAYVALGALVEMGIVGRAAFEEVHQANMRKKRGEKASRPGSKGFDAIKPEGWKGPDYSVLLNTGLHDVILTSRLRERYGASMTVFDCGDYSRVSDVETFERRRAEFIEGPPAQTYSIKALYTKGHSETVEGLTAEQALNAVCLASERSDLVSVTWSKPTLDAKYSITLDAGSHVAGLTLSGGQAVQPMVLRYEKPTPLSVHDLVARPIGVSYVEPSSGFMKFDSDKAVRPELIPAFVVQALGELYAKGAKKYSAENWRLGSSYQRYVGAAERHFLAWRCGEDIDVGTPEQPGTGLHHLVCAAWNLLTLYAQVELGVGEDDCPDRQKKVA